MGIAAGAADDWAKATLVEMPSLNHVPREDRVRLKIIYNGYTHAVIGYLFEQTPHVVIKVSHDQLPRGFYAEHGTDIDYSPQSDDALAPDPSGECGWICAEPLDIDGFAPRSSDSE